MTKIRRIALVLAASAIGGLALNPLAAQAKTVTAFTGGTLAPCFGAPGSATGSVTMDGNTGTFTIVVTGNARDFEYRARYGYLDTKTKKMVFAKDKTVNPTGIVTSYSGTVTNKPGLVIYRLDVVDPVAEQLVYTSDGAAGCD
jgi:hypothetical protein